MTAQWHGYRLIPEDVWFFRDGKPSVLGADHYLRSIFPPFPSTLYGLIRTQRLIEEGVDLGKLGQSAWAALKPELREEIGEWGEEGNLELRGPWLTWDDKVLLPAPADLRLFMKASGGDGIEDVLRLLPSDSGRVGRDWSHTLAPLSPFRLDGERWLPWTTPRLRKEPQPSSGWFITLEGMQRWMSGGSPSPDHFVPSHKLWCDESRTGVGLDEKRRRHEEGRLFTFGFIRLREGVALGFELRNHARDDEARPLQTGAVGRFGGESRLARIEAGPSLSAQLAGSAQDTASNGSRGHVVALITPAILAKGAMPEATVIVTAAVVAGPALTGGWDLATRGPKKLCRAAPAGAIYWVEGPAQATLSSSWSKKWREGFGLMLAGAQPGRNHG